MLEELAKAIVSGLLAGVTGFSSKFVSDTYDGARTLLKRLVPNFDVTSVSRDDNEHTAEALVNRLRGNTPQELEELAAAFSKLAEAIGDPEAKAAFDRVVRVKGVSAAQDVDMYFQTGGGSIDEIENVRSEKGSVKVVSRQTKEIR